MRAIFGVLSLLLVLAVVAVLARKQFSVSPATPTISVAPASSNADTVVPLTLPAVTPGATPEQQSQQLQQQVRHAMDAAMQQPRAGSDDK